MGEPAPRNTTGWAAGAADVSLTKLMVEVVNPAANTLWNSDGKDTLSDRDWDEIKEAIQSLSTAAGMLAVRGDRRSDQARAGEEVHRDVREGARAGETGEAQGEGAGEDDSHHG